MAVSAGAFGGWLIAPSAPAARSTVSAHRFCSLLLGRWEKLRGGWRHRVDRWRKCQDRRHRCPRTHPPRCDREADLGDRATVRHAELMNAGPFEQVLIDRDEDQYGRKFRILVRRGRSLGDILVAQAWHEHGTGVSTLGADFLDVVRYIAMYRWTWPRPATNNTYICRITPRSSRLYRSARLAELKHVSRAQRGH